MNEGEREDRGKRGSGKFGRLVESELLTAVVSKDQTGEGEGEGEFTAPQNHVRGPSVN
jgi:hypothetical protein